MFKKFDYIETHGIDSLIEARKNSKVTLFPTHTHEFDIPVLDRTYEKHFDDEHCKFVMRNDYRIKVKGFNLPIGLSQYLFIKHVNGAIAINQSGKMGGLPEKIEEIKDAFDNNFNLVVFPGATRHFGYINGLNETSIGLYANVIKKAGLYNDHLCIPTSIIYNQSERRIDLYFDGPFAFADYKPKELAKKVVKTIAECTNTDLDNIVSAEEVSKFIKERN